MVEVDLSTLRLLTGCELKASLNYELEVVRCERTCNELASDELTDFLDNAKLGETLYRDQSE